MVTDHEAWLDLTREDVLAPEAAICDAHHHLWDRPESRYLPDDLRRDIGTHRVVTTVFIDCQSGYRDEGPEELRPVGETAFIRRITARAESAPPAGTAIAAGIVSFANLTLGRSVEPVLAAHVEAGKGRFRGIRHATPWDPHPGIRSYRNSPQGLLADPAFREGFACLQRYSLSFDAWLYFHQLPELADLAGAFPDTPIILNHMGGPLAAGPYAGRRDEVWQEWRRGIALLAGHPNVVVKLGGFGMPGFGFGWAGAPKPPGSAEIAAAIMPLCLYCVEQFGVERCMFESNFPVDRVSCSYTVLWNAFKRVAGRFSATEKAALLHDTASRVYRLSAEEAEE